MNLEQVLKLADAEKEFSSLTKHYTFLCRQKSIIELENIADEFNLVLLKAKFTVEVLENNASPKTKSFVYKLGRLVITIAIHYPLEPFDQLFESDNTGFRLMSVMGTISITFFDINKNTPIHRILGIEPTQDITPFAFERRGNVEFKLKSTDRMISMLRKLINTFPTMQFSYYLQDVKKVEWKNDPDYGQKCKVNSISSAIKLALQ